MADEILILIKSVFAAQGTQDAQKAIAALNSALKGSNTKPADPGFDKIASSAGKAAVESERLATQQQKTAQTSNQAATAAQKLAAGEQSTATATAQAAVSQDRAAKSALSLAQAQTKANSSAQSGGGYFAQMGSTIQSSLLGIVGPAAAVGTAIAAIKGAGDLAQTGASVQAVEQSFKALAASGGQSADTLLAKMNAAAQGTISDAQLMQSANTGMLLTNGKIASELPKLIEIARASARATGQEVGFIFDSLTRGIARGSPMIIDNAGITLNASAAFETYAKSIGKSADELNKSEQQQATLNAVVAAGDDIIAKTGGSADTAAQSFARLSVAGENAKNKLGELFANALKPVADGLTRAAEASNKAADEIKNDGQSAVQSSSSYDQYIGRVRELNDEWRKEAGRPVLKAMTEAQFNYAKSLEKTGVSTADAQAKAQSMNDTLINVGKVQAGVEKSGEVGAEGLDKLANSMLRAAETGPAGAAAVDSLTQAYTAHGLSAQQFQAALEVIIARSAVHTQGILQSADAEDRRAAATQFSTQVTQAAADTALLDTTAKQAEAAQTELLQAYTKAAADEFLALNPGITASGVASAYAAGEINKSVNEYIQMILKMQQAKNDMALLQAQAGMSPAIKAAVAANPGDVGRYISTPADPHAKEEGQAAVTRLRELNKQEQEHAAAVRNSVMQTGTAGQKQAILNKELSDASRIYGANSTQAINAKTALDSFNQSQEKAGSKRAGAAQAGANRLESIEQNTGNKLQDIVSKTQDKLVAIDKKAAEERAKAARQLQASLATTAADRRVTSEADDLDLVGPISDPKEAAKLNDRERAQADSRKREAAAAAEARAAIEAGESESGQKIYDIREKQISDQESLDQHFYERQRELAGNKGAEAELKRQYDEATRANEEAAGLRIDMAKAEAQEKAAAIQAEKDQVIAAAEDEMNQVIARASQSAEGVKKASASARDVAVANLRAIGDAVNSIPAEKVIKITVQGDSVGTTSTTTTSTEPKRQATGGATEVGRVTLVGEEGPELVVFDSPGHVYTASQTQAARQGGKLPAMRKGGVIDSGDGYTTYVAGSDTKSGGSKGKSKGKEGAADGKPVGTDAATKALQEQINFLKATAELAYLLSSPIPNLDAAAVQALANETKRIGAIVGSVLVPVSKDNAKLVDDYDKAISSSVSILKNVQDLRKDLAEPQPPISAEAVQKLAAETRIIGAAIGGVLVPIAARAQFELEDYEKAVSSSVSILKDVADLRKDLAEPQPPLDPILLYRLAIETQRASGVIKDLLIPYTQAQADDMARYEASTSSSVSALKAVQDLRKDLSEPQAPLDPLILYRLAIETQRVSGVVADLLVPYAQETADQIGRYEQVVGSSTSALKNVQDLAASMKDPAPPLDMARVTRLAGDTRRVAEIFVSTVIPYAQETADQAGRYEQVVSAATSSIKSTLDLSGKLFADYISPSDAQIAMIGADAERVVRGIQAAASAYSKDGLEAGKSYAEGVGATFTAYKDGLLFFQALNTNDFVLDGAKLATFEQATAQTMETARRLGAQAATIPASDIAALQTTTAALTAQSEALIRLAAVPFGDILSGAQGLAQNGGALLAGAGGGGSTTNIYNTFNLPNGTTQQLAQEVIKQLGSQMGARK